MLGTRASKVTKQLIPSPFKEQASLCSNRQLPAQQNFGVYELPHLLDHLVIVVDFQVLERVASSDLLLEGRPHAHCHPDFVIFVSAFQASHLGLPWSKLALFVALGRLRKRFRTPEHLFY